MLGIRQIKNLLADSVRAYEKAPSGENLFCEVSQRLQVAVNRGTVSMMENGKDASLTNVYLLNVSNDGLVLKPDNFGVRFFRAGSWNKAVDYLILTEYDGKNYAIFIDLKSSINDKPDKNDPRLIIDSNEDKKKEKQFVGAEALFEYIKLIATKEYGLGCLPELEIRKWILYGDVKPRKGMQSAAMPTAARRMRSEDVYTKSVTNNSSIDVKDLVS